MLCNSLFIYKNVNTDLSIPFHFCFSVRNIEENNMLCREKYLKSAIFKGLKKKRHIGLIIALSRPTGSCLVCSLDL